MKNKPIVILPLRSVPEYAPILAYWSYTQWYMKRDIDFKLVLKSYKQRTESDKLPLSYIALSGSLPVGMVSLKENDLWSRKDLNPWLASLFVVPEYRKRGIGSKLITAVIEYAGKMLLENIYLFTGRVEGIDLDSYYKKQGWTFLCKGEDNDNNPTALYVYRL